VKVLIVGAGRLGTQIAQVLAAAGDDVSLIDIDDDRIAELEGHISARLVAGDACEPTVLEDAGALTTDLLVAATGDDEDNLVISLLAKRQFAVPRVAARINDTDNGWLFDHHWGVDVAVPAATPLISLIEEATGATDTVALLRLSKAGVNVIETAITPHSRAVGHTLADITLPTGTVIAAVIRNGEPTVPAPQFQLQAGDELLVVSEAATEQDIDAAFQ
jgi:trk system potassium uptake protein TrkA